MSATSRSRLMRWWGWMLLSTLAVEITVALRYFEVTTFATTADALGFRALMLVAHFTLLTALLLSPLLLLILVRVPARLVMTAGVLLSTALLGALLIDTQVYQLYRFHINAGVLNLLLGGAARETFELSTVMYWQASLLLVGLTALMTLLAWICWRWVQLSPGRPMRRRAIVAALGSSVLAFHAVHIGADVLAYEPLLEQTDVLPLKYAATAKRTLRSLGVHVRSRPAAALRAGKDRGLTYPLRPVECAAAETRPNIIVILIDSWRFDALDERVTPHIEAFARDSARFYDHHSGGNATRIGVFSLFYAIPGTYWHRMLAERRGPVFIDQLVRQRYHLETFRSAPLFSPEFDRTVFAHLEGLRMRSDGAGAAERDRDLTDDFLAYLERRPDGVPFFALLFYDSPHKFALPAGHEPVFRPSVEDVNYFELRARTDPLPFLNRYRNSVHYVDRLVGEVLAALEQRGLTERSVVIITGDHGQEFNDSGGNYWGHGSNFTRYQTGVPLVLRAPGLPPARFEHRTTHFDVVPTLLREYLGCNEPFESYSVGRSLFEAGGRDTLVMSEYADFAIVQPELIAVVRRQGMELRGPGYAELEGAHLDPATIRSALEQKTRFYRTFESATAQAAGR